MEGYSVKIVNASKELTAKERVMLKDTTGAVSLDEATQGAPLVIDPDFYAALSVHNEKAEDKDYMKYIIVDKAGTRYVTGSESFMSFNSERSFSVSVIVFFLSFCRGKSPLGVFLILPQRAKDYTEKSVFSSQRRETASLS